MTTETTRRQDMSSAISKFRLIPRHFARRRNRGGIASPPVGMPRVGPREAAHHGGAHGCTRGIQRVGGDNHDVLTLCPARLFPHFSCRRRRRRLRFPEAAFRTGDGCGACGLCKTGTAWARFGRGSRTSVGDLRVYFFWSIDPGIAPRRVPGGPAPAQALNNWGAL